jgi:Domain of unknown function (DUF4328)
VRLGIGEFGYHFARGMASAAQSEDRSIDVEGLRSRARWAQAALIAVAIVDLIAIGSDYAEYQLLGTEYTLEEADANDLRQGAIGALQLGLLIASAVFFIRWFKRAYENVGVLDRERRYRTGWTIWGWFVPILSLWRPKQIANDIWRSTNADPVDDSVSPLLTLWWAAFLISNWAGQVALRSSFSGETPEELQTAAAAYIVTDAVDFVAALLAIWVVRTVTARQIQQSEPSSPQAIEVAERSPQFGTGEP